VAVLNRIPEEIPGVCLYTLSWARDGERRYGRFGLFFNIYPIGVENWKRHFTLRSFKPSELVDAEAGN